MAGAKHVKPDLPGQGQYPASLIQTLSSDSKFMFKIGIKVFRRGVSTFDFYAAILSGTKDQINAVISQSQNNTYDYTIYDVTEYHGPLEGPVAAWIAAHPVIGHR
jgi:hypothetical protein